MQTVFEPESGYAADVRKLFALLYPGVPVQFINAGISGDNAPSGLQRLERDVLAYHPDLTVVCFGLMMRAAAMRRRRNTHRRWTEFLQN